MNVPLQSTSAFAAFVRENRLRTNMTQDELARAVRKSRRWVHDLESDKVTPSLSAAIEVAATLGFALSIERSERSDILDEIFENLE
ncbi:helix-turn-helix transcriptional regulator [Agromyces mangrovi Wang et al. 2018]|uniref:helix-turn-helix transcriptional regulator n=1 Tax=Agromyces mangrovi TaxID=1858653 RepID=UPI0025722449|nr:helix-turn-helix transcriptional regulator [Agromyces mangrovi]BDZ64843.1 hypothetical protein GCM10025877_17810 [Agromyces mangrovi]